MNEFNVKDLEAKSNNQPINITFDTTKFNLYIKDLNEINDVTIKGLSLDSHMIDIKNKIAEILMKSEGN